jgi:hypothetical protein
MTLVEVCVAAGVGTVVLSIAWGFMHLLFSGHRWDVFGMTRRSFMQKDVRPGLRRLFNRASEAVEILEPAAGTTAGEVILRALTGERVRVRCDRGELISEREENGGWVRELAPIVLDTAQGPQPVGAPVEMRSVRAASFTVLAPQAMLVDVTLEQAGQQENYLTAIETRNGDVRR